MPARFPIAQNDLRVEQWFSYYGEKPVGRERMQNTLFKCSEFLDLIETMLERFDFPKALVAVAVVESGCEPLATSKAGARGIWQFIPELAQAYGLRIIEGDIDERVSPPKLTQAAIKFLADLYRQFGSWELAFAAYNMGPYGLMSRIRRWGAGATFWDLADAGWLPAETTAYVPQIQAVAVIRENAARLKFLDQHMRQFESSDVYAPGGTRLGMVARAASTTLIRVRELNPDVFHDALPNLPAQHFILQVPRGAQPEAQRVLDDLLTRRADEDLCVPPTFDWGKQQFTAKMQDECSKKVKAVAAGSSSNASPPP